MSGLNSETLDLNNRKVSCRVFLRKEKKVLLKKRTISKNIVLSKLLESMAILKL